MTNRFVSGVVQGVVLAALFPVTVLAGPPVFTQGVDYPHGDLGHIKVERPLDCATKCQQDERCEAWAVREQICYMKDRIPAAEPNSSVTSGTKYWPFEPMVDRPHNDIGVVTFETSGDPHKCLSTCAQNEDCVAFSIVFMDADHSSMKCYLKGKVSPAKAESSAYMSGIMENWKRWRP